MNELKKDLYKKDKEGFIKYPENWNQKVAFELAKLEGIELTMDHWKIINLIRKFYFKFGIFPKMRDLDEFLYKMYGNRLSSRKLYQLFPKNPIFQASKIAGLPKPTVCI
ncbi:TusE/DsrC/DsvC family sulfur relay protein [Candidatus Riesia pediculicola]|uniref:Sulfurtransferase n=1 Tax=Riesia pediculicola (strain USDA) TaxID=515618 RepID=D4G8Q4_RIEPU|nr:TusE/DsrC/DsvC family sulfur relay protein [Candidatus Riesia pediculicola]ADD79677.1 dissimilatory sulfite reductase subunit C [Candidatus Riesia pediculicola USDA]ARC53927.1 hypothetical protein AOE55_02095 [Candidatus Riesia pediculicola]QOJ86554.1 TusE/DsrC/DsvC family sulfur relay protein [Candidatus Riesia pediculicola]